MKKTLLLLGLLLTAGFAASRFFSSGPGNELPAKPAESAPALEVKAPEAESRPIFAEEKKVPEVSELPSYPAKPMAKAISSAKHSRNPTRRPI
jgi:hypothetical protein